MGVYIKDMKMPSSCSVCDFLEYEGGDFQPWVGCRLTEEKLEDPNSRGEKCPMVEVAEGCKGCRQLKIHCFDCKRKATDWYKGEDND